MPGADRAIVEPAKVRGYLLSRLHPDGRHKSVFFEALGYRLENWIALQRDLIGLAESKSAELQRETNFGQTYRIAAMLRGPSGRVASIVTFWIVETGADHPRLITAFPGD